MDLVSHLRENVIPSLPVIGVGLNALPRLLMNRNVATMHLWARERRAVAASETCKIAQTYCDDCARAGTDSAMLDLAIQLANVRLFHVSLITAMPYKKLQDL